MMSNRRNRQRRPARQAPRKSPKRRLLIVCEGKVTEPTYIRGLERWTRDATVEIDIPDEHGVPLTLVGLARKRKLEAERKARRIEDPFLSYDEVWCVFDIDEHPNINDAHQLAAANGIELAISNPCFELWILLHFRENPGARHRHDIQRMLRKFLAGYDKHLDFDSVASGFKDAERRAKRLDDDAANEGEPGRNPTTSVFRLTKSIAGTDEDA